MIPKPKPRLSFEEMYQQRIDAMGKEKFAQTKRPGALATRPEGVSDVPGEITLKEMDRAYRRAFPDMEGRGPSLLSQIIQAKRGEKMSPDILEQLKGFDPVKLKEILNRIMAEKRQKATKSF